MQLARDESYAVPLAGGDAGVEQTIELIRSLVDEALKDPVVNRTALEILRGVPPYDHAAEIQAIHAWVLEHIRFVQDPVEKETLRSARDILRVRAGDCDDINGVLIPALLGTVGYATRLVTIASNPVDPSNFSHIYPEVLLGGQWVAVDAARPGAGFGVAPPFSFRKPRVWSLFDSSYEDVAGPRGLAGYTSLGQSDNPASDQMSEPIADTIAAVTGGVAEIIAATKGPSRAYDPWAAYRTSFTPYSPPAGYDVQPSSSRLSQNAAIWIGIGLLAYFALSRRETK